MEFARGSDPLKFNDPTTLQGFGSLFGLRMAEIWEIWTLKSNLVFGDLKIKSRIGGECGEWMWSMIWPSFWDLLSEFAKIALASFCTHWLSNCINNCKEFHSFYTLIWLSNMLNTISIVRKTSNHYLCYVFHSLFLISGLFLVDETIQKYFL